MTLVPVSWKGTRSCALVKVILATVSAVDYEVGWEPFSLPAHPSQVLVHVQGNETHRGGFRSHSGSEALFPKGPVSLVTIP